MEYQKIDISTSTIFRTIFVLLGFWLIYTVFDIVVMLFAAFIVASVAEPVANYMERYHFPRAISVLLFYVIVLLVLAGVIGLMVEPLSQQVRQMAIQLPVIVERLSVYTPLLPHYDQDMVIDALQNGLVRFGDNLTNFGSNVFAGTRSFISGVVNFLFVFVIALYLVIEKNALQKFARIVIPDPYFHTVSLIITDARRGVGRWVLGQLVMGLIMGTLVGLGLWVIGVPYALLLGIIVAVMELVPAIGPTIAAVPGVLVAFTQGWVVGLATLVLYIVVGQIENHILIPNIMKRAVGLHPLVTIIAVILGARLFGVLGVVLAVPTATVVSIAVGHIFSANTTEELAG